MKTSSSKRTIFTSPASHFSLYNMKYCLKVYQNVCLEYFISFYEIICNCTKASISIFLKRWCLFKSLHLHNNQWENSIFVHFKQHQVIRAYVTEALVREIPGLSVSQRLTCVLSDVTKANVNLRNLNKIANTKKLPQTSRSAK